MAAEESKSWFDKRTRTEKYLFAAMSILVLICLLLITGLSCSRGGCQEQPVEAEKYCSTLGCINAAGQILYSINKDAEPCEDFYEFACGNALKNIKIPKDKQYVDTFDTIEEEVKKQLKNILESSVKENDSKSTILAKKFYKSCMNENLIEHKGKNAFIDLLKELGGWPVLEGDEWNEDEFSWMNLTTKMRRKGLNIGYFVQFTVSPDTKNSNVRSIELDQPKDFGLAREFIIANQYVDVYKKLMVNVAVELGANRSFAESEMEDSLNFEIQLANITLPAEERRNYTALYNPMTIEELQKKYPTSGNWLNYINEILPEGLERQATDQIVIVVPSFFKNFKNLTNQHSNRAQANYALWRVVQDAIKYGSNDVYEHLLTALREITKEESEKSERWKQCVKETSEDLTYAVAAMYVTQYFDEDAKLNALNMTYYIKNTFISLLHDLDWMDNKTRNSALIKADKIERHVAYPDEIKNDTILDQYYEKLQIDENQYLQSYLNICVHVANFVYGRLNEPVDKHDWTSHGESYEVGAYYMPSENSIQLPAGILQGIFFNKNRPTYLNFGSIGSIIAHEITHGFDDRGRQLDDNGNLKNWWEANTAEKFINKTKCIIDQYSNFKVAETGENVNGVLTQGENIADNGGVKQAYLAYKSWEKDHGEEQKLFGLDYTPHQLFWISAAMNWCTKYQKQYLETIVRTDSHSPNRFRVLGPFQNSKEFAEDFHCGSDSYMNPTKKCAVW